MPKRVGSYAAAADYIDTVKRTSRCHFCGVENPTVLTFHHLIPADKSFSISRSWKNKGLQTLKNEIAKCIVVCANCHLRIHAGEIEVENTDPAVVTWGGVDLRQGEQ